VRFSHEHIKQIKIYVYFYILFSSMNTQVKRQEILLN
jgi:hypothetical protein